MKRSGFTLVEILITVAVIGLLGSLVSASVIKAMKTAKIKQAEIDLAKLSTAVERLVHDTLTWPNKTLRTQPGTVPVWDLSGASAGIMATDGSYDDWRGPYYEGDLVDPWGNAYFFDPSYPVDGKLCSVIGSLGPDGRGRKTADKDNICVVVE